MAVPPPASPLSEPAAEPPVAAEGAQLSLKVRTLDQKTYPISICAAASVPQLKELVEVETGVTLARQRLIYRGRVLKNDQTLAAYSLEDGHVLHLVVRATPPSDAAGQTAAATSSPDSNAAPGGRHVRFEDASATGRTPAPYRYAAADMGSLNERVDEFQRATLRARSRSRQLHPPPPPRDNDEPDPTMGRSGTGLPNRVLMGATISVPEGADVTMPFLSSMIANLVTQVSEGGEGGEGAATGGRRHVTFSSEALGGGTAAEMEATARALRHHRNRDGSRSSGRERHSRRSSTGAERQAALRARTGLRLESVRATLDDTSLNFPVELTSLPQGDANTVMTQLQQQVEMLLTLLVRFGPRLRLLPAALAQRDRIGGANTASASTPSSTETAADSSQSATAPTDNVPATTGTAEAPVSSRHVIRAIEALQSIGESTDLLARMTRHAFVRQSVQLGEPLSRRLSTYTGTEAASRTEGNRLQAALGGSTRTERRSSSRPRFRVARISANDMLGERSSVAPETSRTTVAAGSSPANSGVPLPLPVFSPAIPSLNNQPSSQEGQTSPAPDDVNGPQPPAGAHISISGMGLPLMSSVVFPFSLAAGLGGSHATTTWNLADFVSRLTSELPISTLYGVMAGDATHLHHVLAHIGFALFSGVDVPRVTRPSIRTWAQDLVSELHRLLRLHVLPANVLDQVTGSIERRSGLGNELLRVVEPFIPDLIDFLVRATSASRVAAFGTSSATFLRTMAQQVVRQLRAYARGESTESEDYSDVRLKRLLRELLAWFGMNEHIATFIVDSLLCWTEGDSRRGRVRQREEDDGDVDSADSPAIKRQR
ncbi:RxLR effector protein [Phytophthora megakarya]|uniref:RxLR effector protein n=1 Tax=Phytophthora megakarya TaxID=4795 RepID=A0A225X2F8_9STRA|nr:RxLR effector protein [Phytophthora megakarya]